MAQPNADLDIHAMVVYQKINMGGYDEYDAPPGLTNMHFQPNNNQEPISDEFKLYGLTANYNLGFATATSATAYYTRVESQTQDVTEALYSLVPLYGFPVNQLFNSPFNETDTTQQFSEELRLASSGDGPLQWIGGVFYSQFKSIFAENNNSQALVATIPGALDSNQAGILYQAHNPYHIKQYAVFGETTYSFLDNWKITGGLRWFDFQSHAIEETSGLLATSGNASQLVNVFNTSNSGLNPKVTLSYEQNHDLTVYGTVAKGFRPGGINQQIPNPPCSLNGETFGPDSIWNYELGEKAKLLDNRLVVNADVYYISWSKVQQSINQACGYPLSVNAGNAASYGPELEISAILSPNWKITASGTFTHADLTSTNAALAAAGATFAPGGALLNVPKYTETTSLTYNRPINDDISFMARISNSYVGPSTDVDFTYASLPTYDLVGLRMGVETDRWSATLFADNLTDKRAVLGINTTGFSYTIPSLIRVATNQPRTIGANLKYRF